MPCSSWALRSFLILALRSGAVGVRFPARFAHRPAFAASRATAVFPPRSRLRARPSTAPANKNAPVPAIVGDAVHTAAQRWANLTGYSGNRTYPRIVLVSDKCPDASGRQGALRGRYDMKSRFALALLASVAVIAAMTTDASAAGRGSGGGGGHGGGGGGFHGGGGGGFHGGGSFHAMGGGMAAAASTPMHSAAAISARCARAACTDMRGAILAPAPSPIKLCLTARTADSSRAAVSSGKMPACARSAIRTGNLARTALLSAEPPASAQARL
jgi:hypothetical protein